MEIAIHLGAHCTDADLIQKTLTDNRDLLGRHGVRIPAPGRARPALRKALQAGAPPSGSGPPPLIADLLNRSDAARLVLSYEAFLGTYATVLDGPSIYPEAAHRCFLLRDLFPGHGVSFFLALRNPATFVPALFEASSVDDFPKFLAGHDLRRITWSEPVAAIRTACPDVPLTLWCNEDLPLIWPEILRAVSGVEGELTGEDAILRQVMTAEGFARLEAHLRDVPPGIRRPGARSSPRSSRNTPTMPSPSPRSSCPAGPTRSWRACRTSTGATSPGSGRWTT